MLAFQRVFTTSTRKFLVSATSTLADCNSFVSIAMSVFPSRSAAGKKNVATAADVFPDFDNYAHIALGFCRDDTHSAKLFKLAAHGTELWNDRGYRMSKATHHVAEGTWFWEVAVVELPLLANLRLGWSQISGDLNAPCGFDVFSYAYRALPGTLFHDSRPHTPLSVSYCKGYNVNDVLGIMIHFPAQTEMQRRLLVARRWDHHKNPTYLPIKESKPLPRAQGSWIRYFLNGQDLGIAFENVNIGRYYPCVSSYKMARVKVNFGPHFKYPPLGDYNYRPYCEVLSTVPAVPTYTANTEMNVEINSDVKEETKTQSDVNIQSISFEHQEVMVDTIEHTNAEINVIPLKRPREDVISPIPLSSPQIPLHFATQSSLDENIDVEIELHGNDDTNNLQNQNIESTIELNALEGREEDIDVDVVSVKMEIDTIVVVSQI